MCLVPLKIYVMVMGSFIEPHDTTKLSIHVTINKNLQENISKHYNTMAHMSKLHPGDLSSQVLRETSMRAGVENAD